MPKEHLSPVLYGIQPYHQVDLKTIFFPTGEYIPALGVARDNNIGLGGASVVYTDDLEGVKGQNQEVNPQQMELFRKLLEAAGINKD